MKVLMTGATGFVGTEGVSRLLHQGHSVRILTRRPELARNQLPAEVDVHSWNPAEVPSADRFQGVDAVIHLAGENIAGGRWTRRRKQLIFESRVIPTRRLLDAIKPLDSRPKVWVSASAIGFYGDRGDEVLTENSPPGFGFLSEVCQAWEEEILAARSLGLRTVALRFGLVLGHRGGALRKMLPPFQLGFGGRLGTGKQWMSWIHVFDLARLLIYVLDRPDLAGRVNAVSPNPVTNREFTETLGKVLGRPTVLPVPVFGLRCLLGDLAQLLLASQRVSADKLTDSGFMFLYPELEPALQDLCAAWNGSLNSGIQAAQ